MQTDIVSKIEKAFNGAESDVRTFYSSFLHTTVFVPSRFQDFIIHNACKIYEEELNYILGIENTTHLKDSDLENSPYFVPVFSDLSKLKEWFKKDIKYHEILGEQLFKATPDTWSIFLNPGDEINKEFTPWEISIMKKGEEYISEIIDEIYSLDKTLQKDEEFLIEEVLESELEILKWNLIDFGKKSEKIQRIFLAYQQSENNQNENTMSSEIYSEAEYKTDFNRSLIVCVETNLADSTMYTQEINDQLKSIIDLATIGIEEKVKLFIESKSTNSLILTLFWGRVEPIYELISPI